MQFDSALADSLKDECDIDIVKALHSQIGEKIDLLKEANPMKLQRFTSMS